MDGTATSEKVQLVFLVDTNLPANSDYVVYHRSLCLACTRILLYLNRFPFREHLSSVQWNYHFFNSLTQDKTLTTKSSQFREVRSELLDDFFSKLLHILSPNTTTPPCAQQVKGTGLKPVKLVYNALGAVVQDYIWDAPEIKSPVRPRPTGRGRRGTKRPPAVSGHRQLEQSVQHTRNYIFICSRCPQSEEELRLFCVDKNKVNYTTTEELVAMEMFPSALVTQFESKGISVHWIDTGMGESDMGMGPDTNSTLSMMSSVLKKMHGTLIPMSVIVCPLQNEVSCDHPQLAEEKEEPSTSRDDNHECVGVLHSSGPSSTQVHNSQVEQREASWIEQPFTSEIKSATDDKTLSETETESNVDCSIAAALPTSCDGSNVTTNKKSNARLNTPLKTILSSLAVPSSSLLKDYLNTSGSYEGTLNSDSRRDDNDDLFWLCTKDGGILCILQLHSMINSSPPNLVRQTSPSDQIGSTRPSLTTVTGVHGSSLSSSRRYSLTGAPLNVEKKPSSKNIRNQPKKKLNLTFNDHDKDSRALNDTTQHCDGPPCIVALGLVKQTEVSLAWLEPTSVRSVTGLYVPRNIRETRINLRTRRSANEETSHLLSNNRNQLQSIRNDSSISRSTDEDSIKFSPPNRPSKQERVSASYSRLHLSPLIHLYRHPISPQSSSRHAPSSLACLRRTVSVPELCTSPSSPSTGSNDSLFRTPTSSSPNFSLSQRERILKRLKQRTVRVRCRRLSVPLFVASRLSVRCGTDVGGASLRALSLSPRYPLLKLRDVLSGRLSREEEEVEMESCLIRTMSDPTSSSVSGIDPSTSLAQSGHFHSKQYLNLCVWLAKHGLLLLVSVQNGPGSSRLALFQPITSLVSTLTFIRRQHSHKLLRKLVNPPPPPAHQAEENQTTTITNTRCNSEGNSSESQLHRHGDNSKSEMSSNFLSTVSGSDFKSDGRSERSNKPCAVFDSLSSSAKKDDLRFKESVTEPPTAAAVTETRVTHGHQEVERLLASNCASDSELYVSLQLLFGCHANQKVNTVVSREAVGSAVFGPLVDLPPFTNLSLLPWFPYSSTCGLDRGTVQTLQEFHSDTDDVGNKMKLVNSLKQLYSSTSPGQAKSHDQSHDTEHQQDVEMEEACPEQGEQDQVRPTTVDDLLAWFQALYLEQVHACPDGDMLLRWVVKTLSHLSEHLNKIDGQGSEVNHERLWDLVCTHVLRSGTQLGEKYEELSSSLSGAESGVTEDGGSGLSERRITEYLLQVLLHFEAIKLCSTVEIDTNAMAKQLIFLLRKLSLLANPGLLGNTLQKIILPLYISSCPNILVTVYEGLMLPLPSDLSSSPDFPSSPPTVSSHGRLDDEDGFDSEEERSLLSLEEPLAPKANEPGSKRLFRYQSFQEVNTQRQITIPSKARRKSKKRKIKPSSEAVQHLRRSPRIAKLPNDSNNSDGGKRVVRTLFSCHESLSGVSKKRKRESEEMTAAAVAAADMRGAKRLKGVTVQRHHSLVPDILVKETPVKKQVENYRRFKLQRLRSKCSVVCSPGVEVIQESPRRSFYSVPKPPHSKTTPLFKTPPIKEEFKPHPHHHISPNNLSLNKEPSPAALHSLLHGHIVSTSPTGGGAAAAATDVYTTVTPHKRDTQRKDHFRSPLLQSTMLDESPDMFDTKEYNSTRVLDNRAATESTINHHRGIPSVMISPDVMASYEIGNKSSFLLTRSPLKHTNTIDGGSWRTAASSSMTSNKHLNYKSARMLTYESENPLKSFSATEPSTSAKPSHQQTQTISSSLKVPNTNSLVPVNLPAETEYDRNTSSSLFGDGWNNNRTSDCISPTTADVVFVSPPSPLGHTPLTTEGSSKNSRVCLLTDLDPSIENESASMMAFALCTPPKDGPRDFHHAFSSYQ